MVLQIDNTSYRNFFLEEQNSMLNLKDSFWKFYEFVDKFSGHNYIKIFDEAQQWEKSIKVSI